MSMWTRVRVASAFLSLLALFGPLAISPNVAAASVPTIDMAMVQIVQGEVDTTTAADAYNDFYALKIITYQVAPSDTRVWTNVPTDARELLVWTPTGQASSGSYGWESSGAMAGSFYVDVPATYNYSSGKFLLHVSYSWTQVFSHGKAVIDLSEPTAFASNGTFFLMAYALKGYNVTGEGLRMTFDATGAMSYYTDKDLYVNESTPFDHTVAHSITISKPRSNSPWAFYLGAAAIVLTLLALFAYARYVRPSARPSMSPSPVQGSSPLRTSAVSSDSSRRKGLVDRKKKMLAEIEAIKVGVSKGTVTKDDAEKELVRLRKEYKSIRNELNRLSRSAEPAKSQTMPIQSDSKRSDEFELVLASLAKIDEDYEKGRLPESSYKSLRKDYLEKASALMDEGNSHLESVDPSEAEKVKLMEAIIALDEEHGRGEIDAKVYEDLRASYKKELSELMKRDGEPD